MVTPNCYPTDPRRYGPNRMSIYSYPERRGAAYPIHPDSRTTIMSDRDDDVAPQRKRIAVACGRCRKRKIRCSGDTGGGGPCTNCKNAGYEPCQFLRVASQEASLIKSDTFSYSLDASRQYQARGSSTISPISSTTQAYPEPVSSYTTDTFAYRAPNFGFGTKPFCTLPTWGHGYDQSYNYNLYQPPYSSVHEPEYGMSQRIASGTPGKPALCVDMEPNYAYSGGNTVASLAHRPAPVTADSTNLTYQGMIPDNSKNLSIQQVAPDLKSLEFQNMMTDSKGSGFQNMAGSVNMGDRLLPAPAERSSMPNSLGPLYKSDSANSIYSSSSKSSQASTTETSPVSSTSETSLSYTSYESSSMPSTSTCLSSYPASLASQYGRSSSDLYSHTGSSDPSVYGSATDSMRQGPDMPYRYMDTTTSITAAPMSTTRRDMPTLNSNGASSFSLGHNNAHFLPHQSGTYMLPAGDLGSVGADATTDSYRKTTGTLRA
ncbi:transcriptional regulatory [Fusarium beomiforme]|uniref:Transcriptional regulatory n=1 Tax=Fusarium beomiforme TaxID=44412 RepID=A0A9P5AIT6_9HYPO|nr:transcriptional regulatory [Fusarium beomiforme]